HHGGEGCERVPRVDEGDHADDETRHRKKRMARPRPAVPIPRKDGDRLFDRGGDDHDSEQDRDRGDASVIEAKDEDREQEPAGPDDEEHPPVAARGREGLQFAIEYGLVSSRCWRLTNHERDSTTDLSRELDLCRQLTFALGRKLTANSSVEVDVGGCE